ncbi:MAG: hypothetical protein E6I11_14785 [Chloroflexi bacterium]|nr:MAG: hypothetical protein E6I17_11725 [Chloroflexota bacterium]TMF82242.1 MAG: hypothetical protein E6I11_14785 [Chloroflexota bacterium]TMG14653.1 MAG: hypothetical protein E6I00_00155 [Chloroflexota bacterium]
MREAVEVVQDLAGGILGTGPSAKDWCAPAIRPVREKYLGGAWPAGQRMATMNAALGFARGTVGDSEVDKAGSHR